MLKKRLVTYCQLLRLKYKLSTLHFYLPLVHSPVRNDFPQACLFYFLHKCAFISRQLLCLDISGKVLFSHHFATSIPNPSRCNKPLRAASRIRANLYSHRTERVCNDIGIQRAIQADTKKSKNWAENYRCV